MMSNSSRFIKLIPSEAAEWLLIHKPKAFVLLTFIAMRARRKDGHQDGLKSGEAFLGDWKACGFTRQEYRTALSILVDTKTIKIIETNRTRKKSTTGSTTGGTKVMLLGSTIYDINIEDNNHCLNHCPTTNKNVKKEQDDDVDLGKKIFNTSETLRFRHKKMGFIEISIATLTNDLLSDDWSNEEISQAIRIMKNQDPELSGSIKKYISTILTNDLKQQEKDKTCQKKPKKQHSEKLLKPSFPVNNSNSMVNGTLVPALAQLMLQNGLKIN